MMNRKMVRELNIVAEEVRKGQEITVEHIILLLGCSYNKAYRILNMVPLAFKDIEIVKKGNRKVLVKKEA